MRIIEQKYTNKSRQKQKKNRTHIKLILVSLLAVAGWLLYQDIYVDDTPPTEVVKIQTASNVVQDESAVAKEVSGLKALRIFTDNEFRIFYDNLLQPNLARVTNPPSISGNTVADVRIRKIAEDRGYRFRNSPDVDLVSVDGYLLQEDLARPWQSMKKVAADNGLQISILSGFRSVERQRTLFLSRLTATGATIEQVASGDADSKVDQVLVTSSIPGYSKHHTGYAFDLLCAGFTLENFKNSPCNTWLSADNFKVAKEHGFIPSYPPLADSQGPDPEAWEYIYVGTDLLYE